MQNVIIARDEAAQAFRDLSERLAAFPALQATCRTLAGATACGNEADVARRVAEHGRDALVAVIGESEYERLRAASRRRASRN